MIPEVVNQVAFDVIGNDVSVTMAAESGRLQLNAFEPLIAASLLRSISHLTATCSTLAEKCVRGITANRDSLAESVEGSIGLVTALSPHIGYVSATKIAERALHTGRTVTELVLEAGLLSQEELETLLHPGSLTGVPPTYPLEGDTPEVTTG